MRAYSHARHYGTVTAETLFPAPSIVNHAFPGHEGCGVATRMAERLCSIAKAAAPNICVTAQTLPEENASTRVLRKLGFVLKGSATDPDAGTVWEWSDENGSAFVSNAGFGVPPKRTLQSASSTDLADSRTGTRKRKSTGLTSRVVKLHFELTISSLLLGCPHNLTRLKRSRFPTQRPADGFAPQICVTAQTLPEETLPRAFCASSVLSSKGRQLILRKARYGNGLTKKRRYRFFTLRRAVRIAASTSTAIVQRRIPSENPHIAASMN
jgi:hypothetical protein